MMGARAKGAAEREGHQQVERRQRCGRSPARAPSRAARSARRRARPGRPTPARPRRRARRRLDLCSSWTAAPAATRGDGGRHGRGHERGRRCAPKSAAKERLRRTSNARLPAMHHDRRLVPAPARSGRRARGQRTTPSARRRRRRDGRGALRGVLLRPPLREQGGARRHRDTAHAAIRKRKPISPTAARAAGSLPDEPAGGEGGGSGGTTSRRAARVRAMRMPGRVSWCCGKNGSGNA